VRRFYTLVLGVLGIALAVVGFEFGDPWPYHSGQILGCVGAIGSLWATVLQYREAAPFEYPFTESSWKPAWSRRGLLGDSQVRARQGTQPLCGRLRERRSDRRLPGGLLWHRSRAFRDGVYRGGKARAPLREGGHQVG
jgi:hypothetical protein